MLIVDNLSKAFGADVILENISFSIGEKDRLAIIGNNGAGKTTLLRAINGQTDYDGKITLVGGFTNIGWLKQEIDETDLALSVRQFIEKGRDIAGIHAQIQDCYQKLAIAQSEKIYDRIDRLQSILDRYAALNADIYKIAKGCNITDEMFDLPLCHLSGGQKSRAAFAQLLYSAADVLLLDEPTNHLDALTKEWVMNYIAGYKGAVISISHDEEYLRRVATKVLMLDDRTRKAEIFSNTYDEFMQILQMRDEYLMKTFKNQMRKIDRMQASIDESMRMRSNKRKKQAMSREKILEKMKAVVVEMPKKSKTANMFFDFDDKIHNSPLSVCDLCFSYDGSRQVLKNINFSLLPEERFIIIGKNGAGKTTLLKTIAGILKPDSGAINRARKAGIGYYSQEQEDINGKNSVLDEAVFGDYTEKQARALLGKFKFGGDKVFQNIDTLSPGERSRLALLKLCMKKPNLMLLDEPTNHLDMPTKKVLAESLKYYKGTILMVSHDLDFLKEFGINRMLLLPSGKTLEYDAATVNRFHQEELAATIRRKSNK